MELLSRVTLDLLVVQYDVTAGSCGAFRGFGSLILSGGGIKPAFAGMQVLSCGSGLLYYRGNLMSIYCKLQLTASCWTAQDIATSRRGLLGLIVA